MLHVDLSREDVREIQAVLDYDGNWPAQLSPDDDDEAQRALEAFEQQLHGRRAHGGRVSLTGEEMQLVHEHLEHLVAERYADDADFAATIKRLGQALKMRRR
jgi:hypothetical protein